MEIPFDMWQNILSKLPVKSLSRLKCVCKDWCSLIQDPTFIQCQLRQWKDARQLLKCTTTTPHWNANTPWTMLYCIDKYGKLSQVLERPIIHETQASPGCDGLLCYITTWREVRIRNPITGETTTLPEPNFLGKKNAVPVLGIGYDLCTERYKVVGWNDNNRRSSDVEIFTLGTHADSWREISGPPLHTGKLEGTGMEIHDYNGGQPVYLNGMSYWYRKKRVLPDGHYLKHILSLNYAHEKFSVIAVPDDIDPLKLCQLGGRLCLVDKKSEESELSEIKLRLLMNHGDDKHQWLCKRINVPCKSGERVVETTLVPVGNGEMLVSFERTDDKKLGTYYSLRRRISRMGVANLENLNNST